MLSLIRRIFELFRPFRFRLAVVAFLVLLPKLGELLVPIFAARVFDALATQASPAEVNLYILQATAFWIVHGNVLPFLCDWFEARYFGFPARQRVSEYGLRSMLEGLPTPMRKEQATMHQAVIEEGEAKIMIFMDAVVRSAIPVGIMGLVALGLILAWVPLLGVVLLVGGVIDVAVTVYANTKLKDRFARLQDLRFARQRQHRDIFNNILGMLGTKEGRAAYGQYSRNYGEITSFGTSTQTVFFGFRFGRDLILNLTNGLTWMLGAWAVYSGLYTIGLLVMVVAWAARATELFGLVTLLHKTWLDTTPAIRTFFAVIDQPDSAVEANVPGELTQVAGVVAPLPVTASGLNTALPG